MFGRTIQLDVVKKDMAKPTMSDEAAQAYMDEMKQAFATSAVIATQQIIKGVAVYMTLDTMRKIIVNRLSK